MNDVLIPEVIKTELKQPNSSKTQTLNIHLNQNIDRRINTYNTKTYNTSNTYNSRSGGLFRFIFDIITIPFKILKSIWIFSEKKFDIKETLRLEKIKLKKSKWVKKYITSTNNVYDFKEVF